MVKFLRFGLSSLCVLALVLASVGTKASASSPIFYEGTVTWSVGRRLNSLSTDFDYSGFTEDMPVLRSSGPILDQLAGIPWTAFRSDYTQNLPAYVSVHSRELCENGGYVYLGFAYAYATSPSIANVTLTPGNLQSALYVSGSVDTAIQYGTQLSASVSDTSIPNTYISGSYVAPSVSNPAFRGLTAYDGTNFAKLAYFIASGQELDDLGIVNQVVYDYGTTANGWNRSRLCVARITVPSYHVTGYNDRSVVWIKLDDVFRGQFHSLSNSLTYMLDPYETPQSISSRSGSIVYLLPVYCYAVSYDNYEAVEAYLASIDNHVANLASLYSSPSAQQQAWLDAFSAQASRAVQDAHNSAQQASYAFNPPNSGNLDLNGYIDPNARSSVLAVLSSILSHTKILAILMVGAITGIIGFIFYGKKK